MPQRVLLIEDNASDVELVRTALAETGFPCVLTVFSDGEAAITGVHALAAATPRLPPALVLLDLNLPRVSGHQVLAMIRGQAWLATVPVVVLSTSNHSEDRRRALAGGASDYLVKPARFSELLTLVARIGQRWLGGDSASGTHVAARPLPGVNGADTAATRGTGQPPAAARDGRGRPGEGGRPAPGGAP